MSAQHTPGPNPRATSEYWLSLARDSRVFARQARNVESIRIYLREAEQYEREAERIAKTEEAPPAASYWRGPAELPTGPKTREFCWQPIEHGQCTLPKGHAGPCVDEDDL